MAKLRKRGDAWQIDYADPSGKRIRLSFDKKKDAEAELAKRVSLIAENRYLDVKKDSRVTLGELIEKYKENYGQQRSFNNWKVFCIERWKEHFGKETLLSNIRYVDLESYRNQLLRSMTQHGTIRTVASTNRETAALHHVFTKAVEWELVEKSPFTGKKSLLMKENNKRFRFLTEDEIVKLLGECPTYLQRIVETALLTGMRKGEILPLKWEQIRNGFIYLQQHIKTDEARQIPVCGRLAELFMEIRKEQGLKSPWVFTYQGKPVEDCKTAFNAALKRAGIRDFHFHDLRHTAASHLVMRGASLKEVQEILGHKTMTMTLRYAHLSQEHKRETIDLLNDLTGCAAWIDGSDLSQNVTTGCDGETGKLQLAGIIGAGDGIRTRDLLITNQLLYH